jgi:hypothetical protein
MLRIDSACASNVLDAMAHTNTPEQLLALIQSVLKDALSFSYVFGVNKFISAAWNFGLTPKA